MSAHPQNPQPLAGVFGWPIAHSLSPKMHQYWLTQLGRAGHYHAFAVPPEKLGLALHALPALGLTGVNLTLPHKEAAFALLSRHDESAAAVGAVNLVVASADGKLIGHNTDAYGFMAHLEASAPHWDRARPVVLCGAGGAARAAAYALKHAGVKELRVLNRTQRRVENLAPILSPSAVADYPDAAPLLKDAGLLVNATSLGMTGQPPLPLDIAPLPQDAQVYDLVYAPLETPLLRAAAARKHNTIDGLGMLIHQAVPSFAAFFGARPVPDDALRAALIATLERT